MSRVATSKMPLQELGQSLAVQCPGVQTQTQQPKVLVLEKSSCFPVTSAIGDCDQDGSGSASDTQRA